MLLTDTQARALLLLDASLQSRRQIGRSGDGPGEYRGPGPIVALDGDRSIVFDMSNRKWYFLDSDRFPSMPDAIRSTWSQGVRVLLGVTSSGVALESRAHGTRIRPPFPIPERLHDSVAFVRLRPGAPRDTIGFGRYYAHGGAAKRWKSPQGPMAEFALHPLNASDQAWLFPDGTVAIARVVPYRVEWRDPNGRLTNSTPVVGAPQQVTTAIKQGVTRHYATDMEGNPKFIATDFATWPRNVPAFTNFALVAGTDGRLYIRRTQVSDRAVVDVFDRQRGRIASVTLPPRSRLVAVGTRGWYLAQKNDDEEEVLVRWTPPTR